MKRPLAIGLALVALLTLAGCSDPVNTKVPLAQRVYTKGQLEQIVHVVDLKLHLHGTEQFGVEPLTAANDLLPPGDTIGPASCAAYVKRTKTELSSALNQDVFHAAVEGLDVTIDVSAVPNSRQQPPSQLKSGKLGLGHSCAHAMMYKSDSSAYEGILYHSISVPTKAQSTVALARTVTEPNGDRLWTTIKVGAREGSLAIVITGDDDVSRSEYQAAVNAVIAAAKTTGH